MDFLDALHVYFRGEKEIGLFMVPFGLGLVGFAFYLHRTQAGGFMWGMVIPLALLGLGAAAGGAGLVIRTDRQVPALEEQYRNGPARLVAEEVPRMARVNRNWPILKATWAALTIVALLLLFVVKREWTTGLGLVLLFACAVIMMIDNFAERRARTYTEHLEQLARDTAPRG